MQGMAGRFDFDSVVVGAGAVGLACGYALACRGLSVAVLEADGAIGGGVSSRNSQVIHAGLYYPTGSRKAQLCIEGRLCMNSWTPTTSLTTAAASLVAATRTQEVAALEALGRQVDPAWAERVYAQVRRFWPGLPNDALAPDGAGGRPKLHGPGAPQTRLPPRRSAGAWPGGAGRAVRH